jgi:hypothetical protein
MVNIFFYLYDMKAVVINEFAELVYDLMDTDNDMRVIESDIVTAMGIRKLSFKHIEELDRELHDWIRQVFQGSVADYFFDVINSKAILVTSVIHHIEDLING